jgi:ABC-type multidrug transport system fused ATPase/permease subunit
MSSKQKMIDKSNFFTYVSSFKDYLGWKIYLFFALTVFAAVSEGIGIVMVLPLMQALFDDGDSAVASQSEGSWITTFLMEWLSSIGMSTGVLPVLAVITSAFILKGILNFLALSVSAVLSGKLLYIIKNRIYESTQSTTYANFIERDTGYYVSLINDQSYRSVEAFKHFSKFTAYFVNASIYISFAFLLTWKFGAMTMLVGVLIMAIFKLLNNYVRAISRDVVSNHNLTSRYLIETFRAYKYLKATNQVGIIGKKFNGALEDYVKSLVKNGVFSSLTQAVREPIAVVFVMGIVAVQITVLNEPISPILVAILLFYRGMNSVLGMQQNLQQAYENIGSFEIINQQLLKFAEFPERTEGESSPGQQKLIFDNVGFSYANSDFGLKDVNMIMEPNKTTAIIGPSGAGKSTIVDLVTGLMVPKSGSLLAGTESLTRWDLANWRDKIGYVTQDAVLFNSSILDNISMFSEATEQSYARAVEAAKLANIYDFVINLSEGFKTRIGENGVFLSGGQKQRISIAREIYRDPEILILDEATSALDTESEIAIQKSIESLAGRISVVVIAHRLSTIQKADTIYVLDDGQVVESGSFKDLYSRENSRLKDLIKLQNISIDTL